MWGNGTELDVGKWNRDRCGKWNRDTVDVGKWNRWMQREHFTEQADSMQVNVNVQMSDIEKRRPVVLPKVQMSDIEKRRHVVLLNVQMIDIEKRLGGAQCTDE